MKNGNGLINVESPCSVGSTTARLEQVLASLGMKVIARIDHADNAKAVNETLKPTILLIFGNPATGTPVIQAARSTAIDLPQKLLVWEDDNSKVWVSYNDPQYIARRHAVEDCADILTKIANSLKQLVNDVVNTRGSIKQTS